jgi:hypothetical protein
MSETVIEAPDGQKYRITIEASGEVRDADGNLVENVTYTGESIVNEAQMRAQTGDDL